MKRLPIKPEIWDQENYIRHDTNKKCVTFFSKITTREQNSLWRIWLFCTALLTTVWAAGPWRYDSFAVRWFYIRTRDILTTWFIVMPRSSPYGFTPALIINNHSCWVRCACAGVCLSVNTAHGRGRGFTVILNVEKNNWINLMQNAVFQLKSYNE